MEGFISTCAGPGALTSPSASASFQFPSIEGSYFLRLSDLAEEMKNAGLSLSSAPGSFFQLLDSRISKTLQDQNPHGDICAANVILTRFGGVSVLSPEMVPDQSDSSQGSGSTVASLRKRGPYSMAGLDDHFALGCMLYSLACDGAAPFPALLAASQTCSLYSIINAGPALPLPSHLGLVAQHTIYKRLAASQALAAMMTTVADEGQGASSSPLPPVWLKDKLDETAAAMASAPAMGTGLQRLPSSAFPSPTSSSTSPFVSPMSMSIQAPAAGLSAVASAGESAAAGQEELMMMIPMEELMMMVGDGDYGDAADDDDAGYGTSHDNTSGFGPSSSSSSNSVANQPPKPHTQQQLPQQQLTRRTSASQLPPAAPSSSSGKGGLNLPVARRTMSGSAGGFRKPTPPTAPTSSTAHGPSPQTSPRRSTTGTTATTTVAEPASSSSAAPAPVAVPLAVRKSVLKVEEARQRRLAMQQQQQQQQQQGGPVGEAGGASAAAAEVPAASVKRLPSTNTTAVTGAVSSRGRGLARTPPPPATSSASVSPTPAAASALPADVAATEAKGSPADASGAGAGTGPSMGGVSSPVIARKLALLAQHDHEQQEQQQQQPQGEGSHSARSSLSAGSGTAAAAAYEEQLAQARLQAFQERQALRAKHGAGMGMGAAPATATATAAATSRPPVPPSSSPPPPVPPAYGHHQHQHQHQLLPRPSAINILVPAQRHSHDAVAGADGGDLPSAVASTSQWVEAAAYDDDAGEAGEAEYHRYASSDEPLSGRRGDRSMHSGRSLSSGGVAVGGGGGGGSGYSSVASVPLTGRSVSLSGADGSHYYEHEQQPPRHYPQHQQHYGSPPPSHPSLLHAPQSAHAALPSSSPSSSFSSFSAGQGHGVAGGGGGAPEGAASSAAKPDIAALRAARLQAEQARYEADLQRAREAAFQDRMALQARFGRGGGI